MHKRTHTRSHTHTHMHTHTCSHTHTHMHKHKHKHTHVHTYTAPPAAAAAARHVTCVPPSPHMPVPEPKLCGGDPAAPRCWGWPCACRESGQPEQWLAPAATAAAAAPPAWCSSRDGRLSLAAREVSVSGCRKRHASCA